MRVGVAGTILVMLADESVSAVNLGGEDREVDLFEGVVGGRQFKDKHATRNAGQTQTRWRYSRRVDA
jgi:hypothetical protein